MIERVLVFLDHASLDRVATQRGQSLDYGQLLEYLCEGRLLVDARCYLAINPFNPHLLDGRVEELWSQGYCVTTRQARLQGDDWICPFGVQITLDLLGMIPQARPDIVVLAAGDGELGPLVLELRRQGVRVEVAGFRGHTDTDLARMACGFIDLDMAMTPPDEPADEAAVEDADTEAAAGAPVRDEPDTLPTVLALPAPCRRLP